MVGGEAGAEAVLPLNDKTLGAIGRHKQKLQAVREIPSISTLQSMEMLDDPNEMADALSKWNN
ncbi:hypothetical protein MU448_11520 [Streptococcus sp. O1]|nr:hypothetical protein [Streptococcus sp. O1]MCQ9214972.1 hypothetical protein [Streptococcus sp. O1]